TPLCRLKLAQPGPHRCCINWAMQADAGARPSGSGRLRWLAADPALRQGPAARPSSGRAGGRAKLLQQTDGMDQLERIEHLVRQVSLLPGPGDANVPKHAHGDAALSSESPADVVEERSARCCNGLRNLHRPVRVPLSEVLAQIARD